MAVEDEKIAAELVQAMEYVALNWESNGRRRFGIWDKLAHGPNDHDLYLRERTALCEEIAKLLVRYRESIIRDSTLRKVAESHG